MGRFNFFSILFLLSFVNFFAQSIPDAKADSYVRSAIELIANEKFSEAEKLLSTFRYEFPDLPFPYIYLAAEKINEKFSENSLRHTEEIYFFLSRAAAIADSLTLAEKNIWNYYAKAMALGYWAYFEGLKGNYFSAFDYGSRALENYDECLKLDPEFTDALIANAIYDYWVSEKLGWLPFVKDNRKNAIKILRETVKKNSYNNNLGVVSLFWILMNEKKFEEARELISLEAEKFPDNRYLLMAYANVEKRFDREKAIKLYGKALELTLSKPRENRINEIILRHKIAMLEFQLKNYDNALEQCDIALSYKLNEYEKNKLGDRLARIGKLKENAEKRKRRNNE